MTFAQKKEKALFDEAFKLYEQKKINKALNIFKEIVTKYSKSDVFPLALYNVPYLYQEIDSLEMAFFWYKKILNTKFNDNEPHYNFPDTHTNIKHKSCLNIGNIYYNSDKYKEASIFYLRALNQYPYFSSSGTSTKKNNMLVANWIADCYEKQNKFDSLIWALLPHALSESPYMSNPLSERMLKFIDGNSNRIEFKKELDISLENAKYINQSVIILLRNNKIVINSYFTSLEEDTMIENIKQTFFYEELSKK